MGLPQDLHQSIEELTSYIQNANRQIGQGSVVPLEQLEETVDTLCKSVQSLEGTSAQLLKPQMAELISSLDELATGLNHFMNEKQQEIDGHG